MRNNKGFTLLELLVAATIIGVMAVFATVSYKNSAADARMAAFKARTDALAGAVQRMRLEYPNINIVGPMTSDSQLVVRKFVESGGWKDDYVSYYVCNGKTGDCKDSPVSEPLACMKGKNLDKQVSRYKSGYIYCVSATATGEKLASGSN